MPDSQPLRIRQRRAPSGVVPLGPQRAVVSAGTVGGVRSASCTAHYSRRSATTGSSAVARRLVTSADKSVAAVTDSAALRRTCVAVGDTAYSILASRRHAKSEPITPNDTPINEKISTSRRNTSKMSDRLATYRNLMPEVSAEGLF